MQKQPHKHLRCWKWKANYFIYHYKHLTSLNIRHRFFEVVMNVLIMWVCWWVYIGYSSAATDEWCWEGAELHTHEVGQCSLILLSWAPHVWVGTMLPYPCMLSSTRMRWNNVPYPSKLSSTRMSWDNAPVSLYAELHTYEVGHCPVSSFLNSSSISIIGSWINGRVQIKRHRLQT